ncbi:cyclin-dependent kinase inhibitor 1-like isoform X1 [Hibiscus syriacus]|uniref:Cyclin-dependent kinase inhibitor 1-like isoform X1 n=1 Tax=Hibiscus syriacus TaxID=106335 RepID=A0A6A2ZT54_HIBSY|nr:cyclin-dependent kinase inhibitor 1-like isoform X1 [Hibiscus syriacus]
MDAMNCMQAGWLKVAYVVFAFCSALFLGALKGLLVGPIAALILIIGNLGVILGLLPAHIAWTVYTIIRCNRLDAPLKVAILIGLPALFGIWLALSIAGTVIGGVCYGFFTPWVSSFEAFRHDNESKRFFHCVVDGTWDTVKGSCTVVRDFYDLCFHSYPLYLKELRESPVSNELQTLRLIHVPGLIVVGLLGLIVEIPFYTVIAIVKSPYMLFKGWFRLTHDLISREGPFLETVCIPIAGLTILLWPIVVIGSILMAIFSSFFIGLYGSVVVYQERSFKRGVAYVIAMVAEFDEYTNDWLYLREGTIFPKPSYRKKNGSEIEYSVGGLGGKFSSTSGEPPAMLMPTLARSVSVREAIKEVRMVQAKNGNEAAIIDVGLPCYSFLQTLLTSIRSGSNGLLMLDDIEINHLNRPKDKILDWFFNPIMVLKNKSGSAPQDSLRAAQIEGISRRMIGMGRSMSKLPTYRRRFRQVVKDLIAHVSEKQGVPLCNSMRSNSSHEQV